MLRFSQLMFLLVGTGLLIVGAIYLTTAEFMPYHSDAVQASWMELNSDYRGLLLGFLKGLGAGAFVCGLAIAYMSVSMMRGTIRPYIILLPVITVAYLALMCFATYTVYSLTPASPPLVPGLIGLGFSLVATALLWTSER